MMKSIYSIFIFLITFLLFVSCSKEKNNFKTTDSYIEENGLSKIVGGNNYNSVFRITNNYLTSEYKQIGEDTYEWTYVNRRSGFNVQNASIKPSFSQKLTIHRRTTETVSMSVAPSQAPPISLSLKNVKIQGDVLTGTFYDEQGVYVSDIYVKNTTIGLVSSPIENPLETPLCSQIFPIGTYREIGGSLYEVSNPSTPTLLNPYIAAKAIFWVACFVAKMIDIYCDEQQVKQVNACTQQGRCAKLTDCGAVCVSCN